MASYTENYFTAKGLKARGWTDRLIAKLLGEPDMKRVNMCYKSGPRIRFYEKGRVHAAEQLPEFRSALKGRVKRQAAARKAVETKRAKLEDEMSEVVIALLTLSPPAAPLANAGWRRPAPSSPRRTSGHALWSR